MNRPPTRKLSEAVMVRRGKFLTLIQTALGLRELQFSRQASLIWLANFPGDLLVNFVYASVLAEMGDIEIAATNLEKILKYDPEFTEAASLFHQLRPYALGGELGSTLAYLQRTSPNEASPAAWLNSLVTARQAFESGNLAEAEKEVLGALAFNPVSALPAILHTQIVFKSGNSTLLDTLTGIYNSRWPDALQIKIYTALANIQLGDDAAGVEKLHWSAAHDVAGQVINRILGPNHNFTPLWPEDLKVYLDLPIPAPVAVELGWNVLSTTGPGEAHHATFDQDVTQVVGVQRSETNNISQRAEDLVADLTLAKNVQSFVEEQSYQGEEDGQDYSEVPPETFISQHEEVNESALQEERQLQSEAEEKQATLKVLEEIQTEFERVAKSINKADLLTADTRFPAYVLLTSRVLLEAKYGVNTANVIIDSMEELSGKITALPNWNSLIYIPDDPKCMRELGLTPIQAPDAWKIKLSLADLDKKLSSKGEMIGCLLIVGGHEVVPFHMLPNPTDDSDVNVPSDNPYATTDENYFIQQWPVGRLPDESGTNEAIYLIEQLRYLNNEYSLKVRAKTLVSGSIFEAWFIRIAERFAQSFNRFQKTDNIGYSAEVWKAPSQEVFSLIERSDRIKLSPPVTTESLLSNQKPNPKFAYFNLHGLKDSPEWYGQRDYKMQSRDPEYPVAMLPSNFTEQTQAPDIVLSEACYGANILEKKALEAISLNFLAAGTRAFIGSTCIAYGSVSKPLIAADLLAYEFWRNIQAGVSVGYALMQAKLNLAMQMTENQGYLDGEDQKTILSFVVYGDPLTTKDSMKKSAKPLLRPAKKPALKTISDSPEELVIAPDEMPSEIIDKVRKVISAYLPGLDDATVTLNPQLTNFTLDPSRVRTRKNGASFLQESQRYVVTLKKSYMFDSINHDHYARMTFDQKGDMIKLSASR